MDEPPIYTKPSPQGYTDALRQIRILEDHIASLEARLSAAEERERALHGAMEELADEMEGTDSWEWAIELRARWKKALATASGEGEDGKLIEAEPPGVVLSEEEVEAVVRLEELAGIALHRLYGEPGGDPWPEESKRLSDALIEVRAVVERHKRSERATDMAARALLDRKGASE